MQLEQTPSSTSDEFTPLAPENLAELDVSADMLANLALKVVSIDAVSTTSSVASRLCLHWRLADALLDRLVEEKFIEKKGVAGPYNYRYAVLDRGWEKLDRLWAQCRYTGPAPVSLVSYTDMMIGQVRARSGVNVEGLERALSGLVLSQETKETLQLVAGTGRSLLLSGPSGNGKTAMARALVEAVPGTLWIPHAIEVDGQVIQIFDSQCHRLVEVTEDNFDRRWVKILPPLAVTGGDLSLQDLELTGHAVPGVYEAPSQMKANGGVLVVDDLGRQRCSPRELLNRWIVPLEMRVDYLTLNTGRKLPVPFEAIVVFATNLTGGDLEDEAFLRRMGCRLTVTPPSPEMYAEIFNRYAASREVTCDGDFATTLLARYRREERTPKCCEPRDLIELVIGREVMQGKQVRLSEEALDEAWNSYFGVNSSSD